MIKFSRIITERWHDSCIRCCRFLKSFSAPLLSSPVGSDELSVRLFVSFASRLSASAAVRFLSSAAFTCRCEPLFLSSPASLFSSRICPNNSASPLFLICLSFVIVNFLSFQSPLSPRLSSLSSFIAGEYVCTLVYIYVCVCVQGDGRG